MSTSRPVCGDPLPPEAHAVATVAGYLAYAGACATTLTAALHGPRRSRA